MKLSIVPLIFILTVIFLKPVYSGDEYLVQGSVTGLTGKHNVYIALWTKDGWLKNKKFYKAEIIQADKITGNTVSFRFTAPPDDYAISVFEDLDGNKKLSKGFFGPREPYGFYKNFKPSFGAPKFKDCGFSLTGDILNADIPLLNSKS